MFTLKTKKRSWKRAWLLAPAAFALVLGVAAAPEEAEARSNCRTTGSFEGWKRDFRQAAAQAGVSERVLRRAFDPIAYDAGVIKRDRRQSFFALSFVDFSKRLVSKNRINAGRSMLKKRASIFAAAEKRFGVPGAVIAAFWALESDFGAGINPKNQHLIFNSLGTLAYDCRRPELFREQLIAALKLVQGGQIAYGDMIGSWAGEIGETQFLPAHVLNHAVDGDGDGRIDLYSDTDVIFSTASYVSHLGWRAGEPWLEEVRVPSRMDWSMAGLDESHSRADFAAQGVTKRNGKPLSKGGPPASLLLPMGRNGPAFLAYRNFLIYPEWNNSLNYSMTAAYLATRLEGAPPYGAGNGPVEDFSADEVKQLQRLLNDHGYDTGGVDGMLGEKSREAVKAAQKKYGLPADSYPTHELLRRLR